MPRFWRPAVAALGSILLLAGAMPLGNQPLAASEDWALRQAKVIQRAKTTPASTIDPALPRVPFERWFRKALGTGATIRWEANDCGEQTGSPGDSARDIPLCAEARATLRSGATVTVWIVVGTDRKGIVGTPQIWWAVVERGGRFQEISELGRLEETVAPWRNPSSSLPFPAWLPAAVTSCCPDLRLPGEQELRGAWLNPPGLAGAPFLVQGDFNGDSRVDLGVLLIAKGDRLPTLTIFEEGSPARAPAYRHDLRVIDGIRIAAPQEIQLRLVKPAEAWAPQAENVPEDFVRSFDAIEIRLERGGPTGTAETRLHLAYWDGKRYAEY